MVATSSVDGKAKKCVYRLPVANITASFDTQCNSATSSRWTELNIVPHIFMALVPGSSPPVANSWWVESQ